jgi:putative flippase GtrA
LAKHVSEGLRYLLMAGVSAVMSLGIPFVLHEGLSVPPNIAVAIGLGAAFLVNFVTAKHYVFQRRGFVKTQFSRFAAVSLLFRLCEYIAFLVLHSLLGIQYMIANTLVLFTSFAMKFFVYRGFVFAHKDQQLASAHSGETTKQVA